MASFVSGAVRGHEPAPGTDLRPPTSSGACPLTLTARRRTNITAMCTVLAAGFFLCLALTTTAHGATSDPTVPVPDWTVPGLASEIALGALFVLSGILVTHRHMFARGSGPAERFFTRLMTSGAATFGPGLLLALILQDPSKPSPVLTAFCTVLPAWALGCLAMSALFRWNWARAHVATVIPVLLALAMLMSCVLGASSPEWCLLAGGFDVVAPETAAETNGHLLVRNSALCIVHLITYFLAGSLLVAKGGGLVRVRGVQRFLVPVLGITLFALSVPLAMGGMDFGQPFLALALAPLTAIPMPTILAGRDVWIGLVAYGWPVHTVLLNPTATGWNRGTAVVIAGLVTCVLAGLSWLYIQRPVMRVMGRDRQERADPANRLAPAARLSHRSARFRLLDAVENGRDATDGVRTEAPGRIQ